MKDLKADVEVDFGGALSKLNMRLSIYHGFMTDIGYYPLIIILFSCEGLVGRYKYELE